MALWQYQCCGTPFRVGDSVTWTLGLIAPSETWHRTDWAVSFDEEVDAHGIVRSGGLVAAWSARSGPAWHGVLYEDHHGDLPDELPATAGVVERIFVVAQDYSLGEESWMPVPGTIEMRAVEAAPKRLADIPPENAARATLETRFLIHLDVSDGPR
jgi:hypothetical protein